MSFKNLKHTGVSRLGVFITLFSGILLFSCHSAEMKNTESQDIAEISFLNRIYDFGTIPYESNGDCFFEFQNTSDVPLVINVVRTTCGCTRPVWPKQPVMPGDKAKIGVTYNTKIQGKFSKTITVYCNAENSPIKLFIKGEVTEG